MWDQSLRVLDHYHPLQASLRRSSSGGILTVALIKTLPSTVKHRRHWCLFGGRSFFLLAFCPPHPPTNQPTNPPPQHSRNIRVTHPPSNIPAAQHPCGKWQMTTGNQQHSNMRWGTKKKKEKRNPSAQKSVSGGMWGSPQAAAAAGWL